MSGLMERMETRKKIKENPALENLCGELDRLEKWLVQACESESLTLTQNVKRVILSGGKRIRPSLAYLSHGMAAGVRTEGKILEILPLMCMLELMHTASLIHDDVIDNADERRGVITIHKMIGRHSAIKCGDFLLAKAMEFIPVYHGTGINEVLADISTQMCLGEVQQMQTAFSIEKQTYENYLLQIRRKTAYLLAASCYTGGLAGGLLPEEAEPLRQYGENIGIAFQFKDDLLDFAGSGQLGKPLGQDLRRGIFTLPVMRAFENTIDEQMLCLACQEEKTDEEVASLIGFVKESGGIASTEKEIERYSQMAVKNLEGFSDSPQKRALKDLAQGLAERRN